MRIVVISDTHGLHLQVAVPPGDVLIHAGGGKQKTESRKQKPERRTHATVGCGYAAPHARLCSYGA
jgi:hypothetical protein